MFNSDPYIGEHITVRGGEEDSSGSEPQYEGFGEDAEQAVQNLARELTNQSQQLSQTTSTGGVGTGTAKSELLRTITSMSVGGVVPFRLDEGVDSRLDPDSDDFDSRYWTKNMRKLLDTDLDYYRPTSLGVAYRNLCAKGISSDADFQPTVLNIGYKLLRDAYYKYFRSHDESRYFDILKPMDALIEPGKVTVVLGRPGAGCSTLLRTIAAQTYGFVVDPKSVISYDGLTPEDIEKHYRGEVVYSAETDSHFPQLTVGQTLEFAALLRTPENRPDGITREQYANHMTKVFMATYGLSHTYNTKVGNEYIRGVSGGERKRVSIAEVSLCGSNLQCWDNATRGLDAATALEFVKALKVSATLLDTNALIAIYQCSQDAYDLFDNVIVLYEGRQIYFGPGTEAKQYFEKMGYQCPQRQTTADFLTSVTSSAERQTRKGWEEKVPRTAEEFEAYWRRSDEYAELSKRIDAYFVHCQELNTSERFHEAHVIKQSRHARPSSPFRVSYSMQIKTIMRRNVWRFRGDPAFTVFVAISNVIMGLILASLFYNLPFTTGAFYYRTAALFFAVLFNAFMSLNEIMGLYEARSIVEKHKKYALYHPSADAFASITTELLPKIITCICFNLVFYFMVHFRREPGPFFFYLLVNFCATLVMSHMFRSVGSYFTSLSASMTPSAIILFALVVYTGFVLPTPSMHGWSRWINYIDPIAYVFEALVANEFCGVEYQCSTFVPAYPDAPLANKVCTVASAQPGQEYIDGTAYIYDSFKYTSSHKWRNFGITIGFIIFFLALYLLLVETNKGAMQKGEVIVFQRSTLKKLKKAATARDIETGSSSDRVGTEEELKSDTDVGAQLTSSKDIFHWRDVCYEVQIKSETRRILDHIDGWVKPGTLTALIGATGAGKTTLLDVLANRVTMGVVSGQMFVNGHLRDSSFQRSIGYVQQQDLHLQTTTVREALRFSAYLRQPLSVSRKEKDDYVENVIRMLEMEAYADAIVGVPGEGLNVEQRKRLTIGVELAAKPKLLLFLDEPTSGLDSQTAWSICQLMRKLADNGQAILCTIHQPSAILMQEFDRLLFLAQGGRTVYFGELGKNCQTLIDYFEYHGAASCPPHANPAEWMLEVIGAAPGSHASQDYHEVWLQSKELQNVKAELQEMEQKLVADATSKEAKREYASNWWLQYRCVTARVFQQYWRTPSYIWSKIWLSVLTALFNGFSFFKTGTSLQGMQNEMLAIFMFTIVLGTLINQMLPQFVYQRDIYEVRERPSKTFSWTVFLAAQVSAEIPWNILMGTVGYFCWYYPVGLYENTIATHTTAERGFLTWLLIISFYVYSSTLGQAAIAGVEHKESAASIGALCFSMAMSFCGVMYYPTGFWSFMYYVSPLTYWVSSILSAGIGQSSVHCSPNEFVSFPPPDGQTCGVYMEPYMSAAGGYLQNNSATDMCEFCSLSSTNQYLASVHVNYAHRWRDWGIFFCYIVINEALMLFLYWLARVPKRKDRVEDESKLKSVAMRPVNELPEER
ncbi:DEKNAAC102123 [Brettanomyces naardenensis]|uniref:DEKNAAC102123 n=1 Tax=Brettanomyces naardenensis TaxID=13370 RepID=A0A448YJX9_BRENA|nr:DEKNAAC102123 [Brettanomyces naardenensis]